jgi:hypothetical protein
VEARGDSQEVIDKEIDWAQEAGLNYWAFVAYDDKNPLSRALHFYLSSKQRKNLNFSLILQAGWLGKETSQAWGRRVATLMGEAAYQKVAGGRPLLYLGFIDPERMAEVRQAVDFMMAQVKEKGLKRPYLVILDFEAGQGANLARELGADAISSYAVGGDGTGAPYAELTQGAEKFWNDCAATGVTVVPIVTSGWDRRPRVEHPVPWENDQLENLRLERIRRRRLASANPERRKRQTGSDKRSFEIGAGPPLHRHHPAHRAGSQRESLSLWERVPA